MVKRACIDFIDTALVSFYYVRRLGNFPQNLGLDGKVNRREREKNELWPFKQKHALKRFQIKRSF
jgi:hypothetical protein